MRFLPNVQQFPTIPDLGELSAAKGAGDENFRKLFDGVAVRHAGDEVANGALGALGEVDFQVFGRKLLSVFTARALPLARTLSFLLEHLQLYSFFLLTALFSLLYLALPNRRQRLSRVLPGALAAAGAWLLFSALFSVYVNHFAKGLALYGSLTTMVLTMLWVYVCVSIVFYGAFFNRLLAQRRENRT